MNSGNPLLQLPDNKFEAPQFDKINTEHFKPAFEEAIARGKRDIETITENSEEPSFKNTIELLEFAGSDLTNISTLFFNLNEANTSDLMQQIALEISPVLSEYSNDIMLNERLFKRVKSVYDNSGTLNLTKEELRLTEECYKGFARNGANLMGDKRDEFRMINTELSQLTLKFGQNLLAATNKFTLHITDKSMLDGLPQFVIDTGAEEAKERSLEGWLFTLHAPSYVPFMQYSNRRELREEMWRAFNSRSLYDQFDNREIVRRIVELRLQRANLLGYSTHAQYVLENNMAGTPQKVESFLDDLLAKTLPFAKKEIDEIQLYAAQNGFGEKIMPWDFGFWSEKYKSEKYSVNDQLLKPYFRLESVRDALFSLAGTLFGLKFISNSTLPVYHPDVKVYEVYDSEGDFISLLYLDYFPRASKRGGAWMT
ncbi:MAG: M3 family metallopeptidase, partial [Bacteroidales bacterium]|nr:M3 family metallopeptidase [Bacteroidales bacterium]